jgi:hypothetical protein
MQTTAQHGQTNDPIACRVNSPSATTLDPMPLT